MLLVRKGTTGRFLAAMRGSETAAAGLGINLTWQRVLIFALSGVVAGIGGTLLAIQQQAVSSAEFNYQLSLAFVVIVVTTGVSTVEGAIQAGFGFVVIQQLLTYLPARFGGNSLVFVLFAFGAFTYASHPEGILEFQKRRWTLRMERLVFHTGEPPPTPGGPPFLGTVGGGGGGANGGGRRRSAGLRPRAPGRGPWPIRWGTTMADRGPLLRVDGVSKVFGGITAVEQRLLRGRGGRERRAGRSQRGRQDHAVQLHLRPAPARTGDRRAGRRAAARHCRPTSGPAWASAAPTSGSRSSRT